MEMELKRSKSEILMVWDSFEGVFNENMQKDQFWKKFIFVSFDL